MTDRRLKIYSDIYLDGVFIFGNTDVRFAVAFKSGGKWRVWYCLCHTQKSYLKLREAAADINGRFIDWYTNEIHKGASEESTRRG